MEFGCMYRPDNSPPLANDLRIASRCEPDLVPQRSPISTLFCSRQNLLKGDTWLGLAVLLPYLRPDVPAVLAPVGVPEISDIDCDGDVLLDHHLRHGDGTEAVGRRQLDLIIHPALVDELLVYQDYVESPPAGWAVPEELPYPTHFVAHRGAEYLA